METHKQLTIGLFGFGVVGEGLYKVLQQTPSLKAGLKKICIKNIDKKRNAPASLFTTERDELLNDPEINPIASPAITTQYIVTGTNAAGCVNYDSVTVKVSADNKGGYLMPTAFTPNNDGKNDCYRIKYWGTILELEFSIYNRWGERVFFTRNPNDCWDGRYKGELQNPAVFIYMIKAKTTCVNEVFRKGTFTLIR